MKLEPGWYYAHPVVYVDKEEVRYWDGKVWSLYCYPQMDGGIDSWYVQQIRKCPAGWDEMVVGGAYK